MVFIAFLLVNVTLFLRPAELVPALEGLPIYEVLMATCLLGTMQQLQAQLKWPVMVRQPMTVCIVGLLVAVAMSHLTHFNLYGLNIGVSLFVKTVLYYLLLVGLVNTPARLNQLLLTVTFSAVFMVGLCVADYFEYVDFDFVTHIDDRDTEEVDEDGEVIYFQRMRGTGIFEDPNDISLVIVSAAVLCFYFMMNKGYGFLRWLWWGPLLLLGVALLCTHSRGGLLSLASAIVMMLICRYGRIVGITAGVLGVLALPLLAGRQGNISISGNGTGQERIQMWAEGLAEMKSPQFLFGIGQGEYADLVGLVAHNSFVHAYVELGFFGGTLFYGCFFFAVWGLWKVGRNVHLFDVWARTTGRVWTPAMVLELPGLLRLHPYLCALITGWLMGFMSLSRCYVIPTYLLFGLATVYLNMMSAYFPTRQPIVVWNRPNTYKLCTTSGGVLMFFYVFVRVFANFG